MMVLLLLSANAQISSVGLPYSLIEGKSTIKFPLIEFQMPYVSDIERNNNESNLKSLEFAKEVLCSINVRDSRFANKVEGGTIFSLKIRCEDALSIHLLFDEYNLTEGAELFLFTEDYRTILGAFTKRNNKQTGMLATAIAKGNLIYIEYFEPENSLDARLNIGKVYCGYLDFWSLKDDHFGDSDYCNVDINCPEGDDWQLEKHAVARIALGNTMCTGSLVNNTSNDKTPYFLTAKHCIGSSVFADWVFYFNYESPACNGVDGSVNQTISGCTLKAVADSLDFCLVELSEDPPETYKPYFAGWSRLSSPSSNSTCIHHPRGDVKKITHDNDAPTVATYSYGQYGLQAHWKIGMWDSGTTEGGSSGSPLFDQYKRIVGSLTGGDARCSFNYNDYYSRFDVSWDYYSDPSKQLKYWLDPLNTGVFVLDSYDPYNIGSSCDSTTNFYGSPILYGAVSGGYVSGNNGYGDLLKAERFSNENKIADIEGVYFKFAKAIGNIASVDVSVWNESGGKPYTKVGEVSVSFAEIKSNVQIGNFTHVLFPEIISVNGSYYIAVSLPQTSGDTLALYTSSTETTTGNSAWEKNASGDWSSYPDSWGMSTNHYVISKACRYTGIIDQVAMAEDMRLYPNPASDILNIEMPTSMLEDPFIEIFDSQGRCHVNYDLNIENNLLILNLNKFENGLYFIRISDKGNALCRKFFVFR